MFPHKSYISSAYYNHDKTHIISSSGDGTVKVFPVNKEIIMCDSIEERAYAFFDLNNHPIIATTIDNKLKLYDVVLQQYTKCFCDYTDSMTNNQLLFGVLLSPDGNYLVTYAGDEDLVIWDYNSERMINRLTAHTSFIYDAKFSEDGNYLVSCSRDGTVKLWDCITWSCIRTYVGPDDDGESLSEVIVDVDNNCILANSIHDSYIWNTTDALSF